MELHSVKRFFKWETLHYDIYYNKVNNKYLIVVEIVYSTIWNHF